MKYAEVAVNVPGGHLHPFSYSIPSSMEVVVGHAVWVPFGPRTVQGIVIQLAGYPSYAETRDISALISSKALVSPERIELAQWIADHYFAPIFNAVALMLPPGFERKVITNIRLVVTSSSEDNGQDMADFITYIKGKGGVVGIKNLEEKFGRTHTAYTVKKLLSKGTVEKTYDVEAEKIKPKLVDFVKLNSESLNIDENLSGTTRNNLPAQARIIELLANNNGNMPVANIRKIEGFSRTAFNRLLQQGLISIIKLDIKRDPLAGRVLPLEFPMTFTDEQQSAWNAISRAIIRGVSDKKLRSFVLHGVTGSGKTEIYLRALYETINRGKKGICLVPEIALTPQVIERFYARFPGKVAVLHSRLSMGEQYDQWHSINKGEYDVVIGSRSAIFAPQPDLGLIIIDEEHEWAYKQSSPAPRYHAREVAYRLAELSGAVLILGSATPDVITYHSGLVGDLQVVELKERAGVAERPQLPEVTVVDMKTEWKSGNRGLFSRLLIEHISSTLANNEQAILYINRRGRSTFIECRTCGYVIGCKRCSAPLAYHSSSKRLVCHHCNRSYRIYTQCPECSGSNLKFQGTGTERVKEKAISMFPGVRVIRFDSDAISNYGDYERIVKIFKKREADILIGTQMLAKGLNFPYVTLVGVINADIGLSIPDFRAAERTFQLLCQVSGRAGRGLLSGRSIIQTFNPSHYAIKHAAAQDYAGFYQSEINYRNAFGYPPFSQMVRMVYNHSSSERCWKEAESMADKIKVKLLEKGVTGTKIVGPTSGYVARLRGQYQVQIILFGHNLTDTLKGINIIKGWTLDVDPLGVV
jgi:primosomal protein N' (replication factor Y)